MRGGGLTTPASLVDLLDADPRIAVAVTLADKVRPGAWRQHSGPTV